MIRTQQTRVPWLWVFIMALPFCADRMVGMIGQSFIGFTLDERFTKDPFVITLINSSNRIFSILLAPFIAWKSDRIWTRFGRRKPFCIIGWLGMAFFVSMIPGASSLYMVALFVIGYNFFMDFVTGGALEPLVMETVPQPQRGRMAAIRKALVLLVALIVNLTLMAIWDSKYIVNFLGITFRISGEQITYYTISLVVLSVMLLIATQVKEVKPEKFPNLNERFSFRSFFGGMFRERQQWKVYSLCFSLQAMNMGLGALGSLMLINQFGYTKAAMGQLFSVLKVFQLIVFVPLAGYLADRFDRLKIFIIGITLSTMQPLAYYLWIHFVSANDIPSMRAILFFAGFDILVDFTVVIAMNPLVFDYVPKAKMGTMYAGMGMVGAISGLILGNVVGLFVKYYSQIFTPGSVTYSSGLLCIFAFGVMGTICALYFKRERRLGRVIAYGKVEHEAEVAAKKAAAEEAGVAPVTSQ